MTARNDIVGMDCQRCREAISARLDGEVTAAESVAVDVHLRDCAGCRVALERAERLTRLVRAYTVEPGPDPATVLLAAWDAAGDARRGPDLGIVAVGDEAGSVRSVGYGPTVWRLRGAGPPECACATSCGCGCQNGRPCRCGHAA